MSKAVYATYKHHTSHKLLIFSANDTHQRTVAGVGRASGSEGCAEQQHDASFPHSRHAVSVMYVNKKLKRNNAKTLQADVSDRSGCGSPKKLKPFGRNTKIPIHNRNQGHPTTTYIASIELYWSILVCELRAEASMSPSVHRGKSPTTSNYHAWPRGQGDFRCCGVRLNRCPGGQSYSVCYSIRLCIYR